MSPGSRPEVDHTDLDLHTAAVAGDRDAMGELLARHESMVFTVCRRLLGNDPDAADATQDTLIKLVTRLETYDGRAKFSTWAYRVASNTCLDELRRRKRRPEPGLPGVEVEGQELAVAYVDGPDLVPDRLDIEWAVTTLQEDFRVPVVLRDLCDMDYASIAEALDLPIGTVRSRISRGRAALAAALRNQESSDKRHVHSSHSNPPSASDLTDAP